MGNPCIKTGCNVAFESYPQNVYHGDAHQFNGNVIFNISEPTYMPEEKIDFLIKDMDGEQVLETYRFIAARMEDVIVVSKEVVQMWLNYQPELLKHFHVRL